MQADIGSRTAPRERGSELICSSLPEAVAERSEDDLVPEGGRRGHRALRTSADEREIR